MISPSVEHIIWDWNGTLFDDLHIVVESVNVSLAELGAPPIDAEAEPPSADSLLELITVGSPLDTLATEIPSIPDSSAAAGRERVLADRIPAYDIPIDLNVRVMTFVEKYSEKESAPAMQPTQSPPVSVA